ncbi:MAG: hypothetical protein KBD64_03405 [Gammaproteobacteria bacterium]|nr:hypothetical protein [Gammaproteobacteria bacterium]
MMLTMFGFLLLSMLFGLRHYEKISLFFCLLTIAIFVPWFLDHIYNPQYGFSMPWLTI